MSLSTTTRSFIGKGKFYLQPSAGGARRFMGNVRSANFAIEEETKELSDYTQGGGGVLDSVSRISSVNGEMEVTAYDPANIALGLYGTVNSKAGGEAITDESHTVASGGLEVLDNMRDPGVALILTNAAKDATYVEDTDYTVSAAGFTPIAGAGIADGSEVLANYTTQKEDVIEALVNSGQEFELFWEGLNDADSGNPVFLRAHRVKFSPTSGLDLISDDFGALSMSFSLLQDATITANGLSKYLQIRVVA